MAQRFSTLCVLIQSAFLCAGCQTRETAAAPGAPFDGYVPAAVEVVQVRGGARPLVERLNGTVRAAGEVAIFPDVDGPVVQVYVENGDAVRRGDPLVRIRATASQSQLQQARSSLAAARAELVQAEATAKEGRCSPRAGGERSGYVHVRRGDRQGDAR